MTADLPITDLSFCRREFPALEMRVDGFPAVFLDGPSGTQVPRRVVDRMVTYLTRENANVHGPSATSRATDAVLDEGRRAMADFLGARPEEIAFGQNMTTLNFALARALGRHLGSGDEIVITDLDHEGNRGPWLALEEKGVVVRSVRVDRETASLDMDDFGAKLGPRTRVVAVTGASNAVGTVTDLRHIHRLVRERTGGAGGNPALAGAVDRAVFVVDAVHLAPHKPIDVRSIGCDFLLCSPYKFFGPHLGVLYGRRDAFRRLETYKLRPQSDLPPFRIETGTLVHEAIAGVTATVDFIADLGRRAAGAGRPGAAGSAASAADLDDRRRAVTAALEAIDAYEQAEAAWLLAELERIPGLKIYGPPRGRPRTPTISFRLGGHTPERIGEYLAERGVFVGAGAFYATTLIEKLGLAGEGKPGPEGERPGSGVVRMGLAPYTTRRELERVLDLIAALV